MGSIIKKVAGSFSKRELRLRSVDVRVNPSVRLKFQLLFKSSESPKLCEGTATHKQGFETKINQALYNANYWSQLPANTSENEHSAEKLWRHYGTIMAVVKSALL